MDELKTDNISHCIESENQYHILVDTVSFDKSIQAASELAALKKRIDKLTDLNIEYTIKILERDKRIAELEKYESDFIHLKFGIAFQKELIASLEQQLRDAEERGYQLAQTQVRCKTCKNKDSSGRCTSGGCGGFTKGNMFSYAEARAAQEQEEKSK